MKCPVCGSEQPLGMAYCDQCGSPLSDDAAAPEATTPAHAPVAAGLVSSPAPATPAPANTPVAAQPEVRVAGPAAPATPTFDAPALPTQANQPAADSAATVATAPALTFKFNGGAQFSPTTDVVNIGRSDAAQDWHPELDVIPYGGGVPEMGVSRHHARLVRQDGKYMLMDVGSTNGTYVNGTAIEYNKAAELKDGDTVAFGAFSTQVVLL